MKSRYKIAIQGIVQGVGFRPFVYQQALAHRLTGFVANTSHGVDLEVEGEGPDLDDFIRTLRQDPPPLSHITSLRVQPLPVQGDPEFTIRRSQAQETRSALISPDVAVCPDCLREMRDPAGPAVSIPFHQLHQLRAPLHHYQRHPLRPGQDHHGGLSPVSGVLRPNTTIP